MRIFEEKEIFKGKNMIKKMKKGKMRNMKGMMNKMKKGGGGLF